MHDERITLKTRKIQTVEGGRIEGERVGVEKREWRWKRASERKRERERERKVKKPKEPARVYAAASRRLARGTKGEAPLPLCAGWSKSRGCAGRSVWAKEGGCASLRYEAERCRRRRRHHRCCRRHLRRRRCCLRHRRCRRRRHLEQIMARIRRGGERTAGRTGFSWIGLGWVGITSAIDLITLCGPRCLLVPVPRSISLSLSFSFPLSAATSRPAATLPRTSSPSHSLSSLSLSLFPFSLFPSLSFCLPSLTPSSSIPRVPSPRVTSRSFSHLFSFFLSLLLFLSPPPVCLHRLFARFLSPFRSYFLAPASSRMVFRVASLSLFLSLLPPPLSVSPSVASPLRAAHLRTFLFLLS